MMKRLTTIAALVCSILAATAHACLWDRDTLAAEARGLPGITEIITGRFDRFPPLFYEMRLERVTAEIATDPDNLELYDDAGVACDRLGRSDDAIGWMTSKRAVMDRLKAAGQKTSEHEYRYLANLGTFHIHRWLRNGADREDMVDVEHSRELIAAVIELNPDAHFGRERYQLLAIEWILDPPTGEGVGRSFIHKVPDYFRYEEGTQNNKLADLGYPDAARGISGLIVLGSAWESTDVFYALAFALADRNDASTARLAMNRARELVSTGRPSLLQGIHAFSLGRTPGFAEIDQSQSMAIDRWYREARTEAKDWNRRRDEYISSRLEQGQHPDTDPKFWNAWRETTSPPKIPGAISPMAVISVGSLVLLLFGFLIYRVILNQSQRSV